MKGIYIFYLNIFTLPFYRESHGPNKKINKKYIQTAHV